MIEKCFIKSQITGKTVMIIRGQLGYFEDPMYENVNPDILNEFLGVNKKNAEAMIIGSMFGWNIPGARIED